ncbi:hypothetical protein EIN_267940 [Entamoeba invadens IP1]|uniref:LITAF domain-containing protein n=1 Tax=Entamoeba invadens IP1 TaxID=370355 RepID=A0A0A1U833_ENTIV|nr:hypothetical protein EIN_267940 [Entamoeba invadens IP1]ELP91058.1 hypothetical protein EIN_267940 [Entamoeba invadens IP1]|eukprot:XP_004257829.1 hypothetical protein EIN_267940 [Entamoeba invadens IP1]
MQSLNEPPHASTVDDTEHSPLLATQPSGLQYNPPQLNIPTAPQVDNGLVYNPPQQPMQQQQFQQQTQPITPQQPSVPPFQQPPQQPSAPDVIYNEPPQYNGAVIGTTLTESYQSNPIQYQQPTQTTPIINQQQTYPSQQLPAISYTPCQVFCSHCNRLVISHVDYGNGTLVWIICCVLCIIGLPCCACIPCCITDMKDAYHKCPNCKNLFNQNDYHRHVGSKARTAILTTLRQMPQNIILPEPGRTPG